MDAPIMMKQCDTAPKAAALPNALPPTELSVPGPDSVTLAKKRSQWSCIDDNRLRNNLFAAVGFLELANAGDFAANVWNDVPVPIYAIVFMAIGGTSAFVLSICAFFDSRKAWRNIKFLRQQKQYLETEKENLPAGAESRGLDVFIEITTRELRIEVINRWAMDLLMGGGAMLISIGTYMAIGGANRKVWHASNILSGYLGNAPIALFGLISAIWASMVVSKMRSHVAVAKKELQGSPSLPLLKQRCFNVQLFFILNGIANVLGGVGSMITAERWWGYCILIPVIVTSIFCNVWWRHRVGYDRPCISTVPPLTVDNITEALESTSQLRHTIQDGAGVSLEQILGEEVTLQDVLELFVKHDLFEQFSLRLVANMKIRHLFVKAQELRVQVSVASILDISEDHHHLVLAAALRFLKKQGPRHLLHRERFLIEVLGTYLNQEKNSQSVEVEK